MDDGDEMDSLFEGMVLFTPSQFSNLNDNTVKSPEIFLPRSEVNGTATAPAPPQDAASSPEIATEAVEPLDENMFSDLTIVSPVKNLAESTDPVPHLSSSSSSSPYVNTASHGATAETAMAKTSKVTSFGRQVSRKKKRAAGLRIGYGRHENSNLDEEEDDSVSQSSDSISQPLDSVSQPLDSVSQPLDSVDQHSDSAVGISMLELVKAQISEKLSRARELAASVTIARKDAIRRRRQASEDLRLASTKHVELEKQLEEAIEAEDFESAERISESLAAADRDRQNLMVLLREAESRCDALDSKMKEVLLSQITAEEESATLLRVFSTDAEKDADSLLEKIEAFSSKEMEKWHSSIEDVEVRKIELDIESVIVDNVRLSLNGSLEESVEQEMREKDSLCKKKEKLADELQELLALVRAKEKEIEENDIQIKELEKRIDSVVSDCGGLQTSIAAKFEDLQAGLSQVDRESEALSRKKKDTDEFIASEKERGAKLRDLSRVSADEANEFEKVIELRKSLISYASKAREDRAKLVKTEEKLCEEVQMLQKEVSSTRELLKELSSKKSIIQQNIASFKEKMLFIEKRIPELEAEKKVAAAARNFKEAGRIAAEAKSLSLEKENIQTETGKSNSELEKYENKIEETIERLKETERLILLKEKEVAFTRFQRLRIDAGAAKAERSAALELGDPEEADLLLGEAREAESEAEKLKRACDLKAEEAEFGQESESFISMELIASLGLKQLEELAASVVVGVDLPVSKP
ncbi:PREDICTED: coiled-coil domain-containing protein 39 [Tarenaya hassleriana]|uniref:coiled-coil domain-containing protein 39 n=1 Tax=Tarenaya hassleriana TaxID=28532 RepID=UPI00053C3921|nr:PREDICTED: coiled-coil domain-containing protein 39 [Tarenaya hassleriana]